MNIGHISGGAFWNPLVITFFGIALLSFIGLVLLLPILDKRKSKSDGVALGFSLGLITIVTVIAGLFSGFGVNMKAADSNFAEQLKTNYGLTTQSNFNDVRNSATFSTIVVFADKDRKFEVRPHLDGDTLTFFRVDNGAELKPNR